MKNNVELKLIDKEYEDVKMLFQKYFHYLGEDLSFQDYQQELMNLPGKYASPKGRLYVAYVDDKPAGCIALRPIFDDDCEIKRLYVDETFRGHGLGRLLGEQIIKDAQSIGYHNAYFDTLERLSSAISLYEKFNAVKIPAYYDNPLDHVVYYKINLKTQG